MINLLIGPVVWYQSFEYAVSHWLQKATEHVFGCVLCSPGCFSLFRASALMSDDVIKIYTRNPTTGLECIQYDQGLYNIFRNLFFKSYLQNKNMSASHKLTNLELQDTLYMFFLKNLQFVSNCNVLC